MDTDVTEARTQWTRVAIGLAICVGFGLYGAHTAKRWAEWPTAPVDVTVGEAVARHEELPWLRLTDGEFRCEYGYTEGTFSYYALTDGAAVVLVGYEDQPPCPPAERPSGAFREIASPLLEQLVTLGFERDAIVESGAAEQPVFVLFTHEGPGNFAVTVPTLFALSLIGLAYARTGWRRRAPVPQAQA